MNQELNTTGPFIIISQNNNATVNLNGALDYDTQNSYRLNIAVRDAKVANSQVTRYLNVFVTPFYTRNPQFAFDSNNCTVKLNETFVVSNDSKNQVIYTFKAKPNHKDAAINYYLDSSDDKTNKVFQLNKTTGELIIIDNNIASITRKTYGFVVKAQYMNVVLQNGQQEFLCALNNSDQSKISVTFTLNSPPPVQFTSNTLPICIPTTAEKGSTIDNLRKYATDQNKKDDIMFKADDTNPAQNNRNLKIMENGDLVLSTNPANIIGFTQLNVKSYYKQNPESETLLTLMGYIVNQTTDLTLITLNKKIQEFETKNYKNVLISQLRNFTNNGYVCLASTDPHILLTGGFNDKWTDVYLYVIDAVSNRPVTPLELDKKFNTVDARKDANVIGITGANTRW
ncbi:hypothetical protein HELRODRAFT_189057, partial [Helobdella robusta]|uniref:Cadherin domain-containing protein n=1 Tax=Helobdella robusta TaxID=6412 RepID=T1FQL5_HELRO